MSYNGSGVFTINTTGQPVVTGTTISSTVFNTLTADLATGLTTALTKDGQSTPTANIKLGAFKITNLGAATLASDAARLDQIQGGGAFTFVTAAGTDTITGTTSPTLTAYATGNQFSFLVANTNTGAVTINVDALGAKAITRTGTTALVAGDMVAGQAVEIIYDGTRFQLVNGNSFTNVKVSGTLAVTGVATFTAQPIASSLTASLPIFTDASKGLVSNTMTGTGDVVMSTSPTLVTPVLGTPTSVTLTNATGLPPAGVVGTAAILGANTFTAAQEWATGSNIASAATINLNTATGNRVHITGTTTITAVTLTRGPRTVIFDGILTLTHHATNNNLPSAANITTAAGDRAIYESDGTTVYCVSYIKANGAAVVATPAANGLVWLSTVTASNSATVDVENTFNSTYANYLIVGDSIRFASNNVSLLSLHKKTTYRTADYKCHAQLVTNATATYLGIANETSAIQIAGNAGGADNRFSLGFSMNIFNPSSTSLYCMVTGTITYVTNTESARGGAFVGFHAGATGTVEAATTGVRFYASSGNITAGTFRLYGIANS